jgi:di/tricarboxylate transporter
MLDVLMAIMSFVAVVSIFCLCWLGWTLTEQLKNNDEVINRLQDEIKELRESKQELWQRYKRIQIYVKNNMQIED